MADFLGTLSGALKPYVVDDIIRLCCEYGFYHYIDFSQQQIEAQEQKGEIHIFNLRPQDRNLTLSIEGNLPHGVKARRLVGGGVLKSHIHVFGLSEETLSLFKLADEDCKRLVPIKDFASASQTTTLRASRDLEFWEHLWLPLRLAPNVKINGMDFDKAAPDGRTVAGTENAQVRLKLSRTGVWYLPDTKQCAGYGTIWLIREMAVISSQVGEITGSESSNGCTENQPPIAPTPSCV